MSIVAAAAMLAQNGMTSMEAMESTILYINYRGYGVYGHYIASVAFANFPDETRALSPIDGTLTSLFAATNPEVWEQKER